MGFTSLSDRLFSFFCFFYWNLPILRQTSCVIDASCVINDVMNRVKSRDEVHNGLCDELYDALCHAVRTAVRYPFFPLVRRYFRYHTLSLL